MRCRNTSTRFPFPFNHRGRKIKIIFSVFLNGPVQFFIPIRTHVHIVVDVNDIICLCQAGSSITRQTNTCILGRIRIIHALLLDPIQRPVGAVIDVQNDLMRIKGIFQDTFNAKLYKRKIVPSGNEYGKNRAFTFRLRKIMNIHKFLTRVVYYSFFVST